MRIRNLVFAGVLAVLAMPSAAHAYPLVTTSAVNVRAGAGTGFVRIATLPAGALVAVAYCRTGWCAVGVAGIKGWVSARYLAATVGVHRGAPPVIRIPPATVPRLVVPRGHIHDYGHGAQHKFQRRFE